MTLPIVLWPAPVLDNPTRPVTDFSNLEPLIRDMEASMRAAEGIGIAANQVGVALRIALVGREDGSWFEIVNPEVLSKDETLPLNEGCLSVPGEWHDVKRYRKVKVRYQDRTGATHELEAEGKLAHVLQHEIDHLDGKVYVTHLGMLSRRMIRERMLKRQKELARRPPKPQAKTTEE
jgi:peptide deformylase